MSAKLNVLLSIVFNSIVLIVKKDDVKNDLYIQL